MKSSLWPSSALALLTSLAAFASLSTGRSATLTPQQAVPLNERVLVVYNQSMPESLDVANYYMAKRAIPSANRCAISSAQTAYITDWAVFNSNIKTPIRNCLNAVGRDKILYIVFSYQTPYKVGSAEKSVDQQIADIWDEYSSDDDRAGQHPYFADAQSQGNFYQPFISLADYRAQASSKRLYSVWRLDAANSAIAKGLVDKALQAEAQGLSGRGCFDRNQGDLNFVNDYSYGAGDWDINRAAEMARIAGFPVMEDNYNEEFGTSPAPLRCDDAALYAGWYSYNNYNDAFTWRPGAVGFHTDSASALDVRGGTNWSANALIKGITVTSGAVKEPFLDGVAHPDGVFRNLFEGANVGDALLRNTKYLKWMILNMGDPLYRPFPAGRAPFNSSNNGWATLALNPWNVGGGGTSVAVLTLPTQAGAGGLRVALTSSNTGVALVPSSITVPEGATTASFNISTRTVASELYAKITASYSGGTISNTLVLKPTSPPVVSLTNPAPAATFSAPASITLSANASDSDGIVRVDFYSGSVLIGADNTSPYSITWSNVPAGSYTLSARATDSKGAESLSNSVNVTVSSATTIPPVLLVEENSNNAAALESVSGLRDPFSVLTQHNLSQDQRTRLSLFALNMELKPDENSSAVTAQAELSSGLTYPLVVEYLGRVPLLDWLSQLVLRLPDELSGAGDVWVSVRLRGATSNRVLIRIKP